MADIIHTLPNHWKYVSEGGATIVFSYIGPSHPNYDGMVLRLRKVSHKSAVQNQNAGGELDSDDPIIEYQRRCMARLFPGEALPCLESVQLERTWLEELANLHEENRPKARTGMDHIDYTREKGVLATDLVGGDWIAIEIKPKWGFLPSTTHLSENTKAIKSQTCRFCMHSHLRSLKNGKYMNNFCPLDLFSGNAERVCKAVDDLWEAWECSNAGVNNFKVFARGRVVKSNEIQRLLHEEVSEDEMELTQLREHCKEALCKTLLDSPVLNTILKLQRSLDALDIEGLSKLWHQAILQSSHYQSSYDRAPPIPSLGVSSEYLLIAEPSLSDWEKFLDEFQSPQMAGTNHNHPTISNLQYYILAYTLSATFKDCSIILKLDFIKPGQLQHQVYPISVIDLDPKSLDRLAKWEELDKEIVTSYKPANTKVCVDNEVDLKVTL